jgi:ATP phosphoribosyltransferase
MRPCRGGAASHRLWMWRKRVPESRKYVLALPKGRILTEVLPLLSAAGIEAEPAFSDKHCRQLRFTTNLPELDVIRVRSFDVATFVAFGAADLGIVGSDVLMEFDFSEVYAPVDLGVGRCRMAVAESADLVANDDPSAWSHVRVATKYPMITSRHFAGRGVQAECIRLSGAIELASALGLCQRVVDLVSTGETLRANGLTEVETIADITSRLAVNRTAWKTRSAVISGLIGRFREVVRACAA